ncbi:MAG: hypothetical protein GY943_24895 [Chloroflexi bacterium]|nr:hypothetical protein [Chloroflexota bacterium]
MMNRSEQNASNHNIKCEQVDDQLLAYAKGALPSTEQRAIANHIANCDRCALALHELRSLESDLKLEASRYHPQLSPEASQRIQQQVYRRMRLSMVWQRLFQTVRAGAAVAGAGVMLIIAVFVGYQWLQFMANPVDENAIVAGSSVVETEIETGTETETETAVSIPTPVPTDVPVAQTQEVETQDFASLPILPPTNNISNIPIYWQDLESITPGDMPPAIAREVLDAALDDDASRLNKLLAAMSTHREPSIRLWQLFTRRCQGTVEAFDFSYRQLPTGDFPLTAVHLYYQGNYTGEIKFRRIGDDWFAVFSHPPLINECLQAQFVLPREQ